jgi:hypothetical protein
VATVAGPGGVPTGAVTFRQGTDTLGTSTLSADGSAKLAVSNLAVGSHPVAAVYGGDARFAGSMSHALTQVVDKAATTTTIASSANPAAAGQTVTFTATVAGPSGTPTGSVTFMDGAYALGAAPLGADGSVKLAGSPLASGRRTITAAYAGDASFAPSVSPDLAMTVWSPQPSVGGLLSGVILVAVILTVALFLLLVRRLVYAIVRRVVAGLARPVRRVLAPLARLLRLLRVLPKAPAPKTGLAVGSVVALGAGTVTRVFAGGTENDEAIARDFDTRRVEIQRNHQIFCTWLSPVPVERMPYDKKQAEIDEERAKHLLNISVPITANPLNLYEDIDSAFIVELLKDSDKPCFYVLSEFRKTINSNVLALSVLFSVIVSLVAVSNLLFSTAIDFCSMFSLSSQYFELAGMAPEKARTFCNRFVFALITCTMGYLLMMLFYHTTYKNFQINNGQQMTNFLVHYLDTINIHFREVGENAARTVTEEKEAVDEMKHDTVLWITNLQWMAFRVFFIECYLRNVIFQIHRNSSYYVLLVPLSFIVSIIWAAYLFNIRPLNAFDLNSELYRQDVFYPMFFLVLLACYRYLSKSISLIWQFLQKRQWSKFQQLNIHSSMTKTLHAYVEQLHRWRTMMKSRG